MGEKKAVSIPDPMAPLNADEIEEAGIQAVGLNDYVITTMMEFIEGVRPLNDDTWSEYVAECEAKGAVWLEDTYNTAEARVNR